MSLEACKRVSNVECVQITQKVKDNILSENLCDTMWLKTQDMKISVEFKINFFLPKSTRLQTCLSPVSVQPELLKRRSHDSWIEEQRGAHSLEAATGVLTEHLTQVHQVC